MFFLRNTGIWYFDSQNIEKKNQIIVLCVESRKAKIWKKWQIQNEAKIFADANIKNDSTAEKANQMIIMCNGNRQ